MSRVQRFGIVVAGVLATAIPSLAIGFQPVGIQERARGAERVVVATVAETSARYERNEYGDDLIVTRARLAVEEVVKGQGGEITLALDAIRDATLLVDWATVGRRRGPDSLE